MMNRIDMDIRPQVTIRPIIFLYLLTFGASFTAYLFTLSPTVGLEDSGEFITAVASLGVAHPSGYPLYVVLGKLFTLLIPIGDIAWRVNLFSAFCASATGGLFSLFLIDIFSALRTRVGAYCNTPLQYVIATSVALSLAFSPVFWSQSVIAEVYTLNALLVVVTLHLLWRYWLHRRTSTLYIFAFVYGLSINNHQMMLLLAPVYFLFLFFTEIAGKQIFAARIVRGSSDKLAQSGVGLIGTVPEGQPSSAARKFRFPAYCIALLLFLLGLSFYLFILFRAGADPLLNWDHPETLERLWRHFTRQSYGDVSGSLWGDLWALKKVIYVHYFFTDLLAQLTPIGGIFALIGFLVAWFRARPLFLISFGVFLMNSLAIIFVRKLGYQYEGEQIYRVYYIPAYLISFLWAGVGVAACGRWVYAHASFLSFLSHRAKSVIGLIMLLSFPVFLLASNFPANDKSDFWIARDWGAALLESLAPNAVLMLHNEQPAADSQIFIITYLMLVEGIRPDVAVVDVGYLSSRFYHPVGPDLEEIAKLPMHLFRTRLLNRVWNLAQEVRRPVYTVYPVGASPLNGDLIGRSNGLTFRVYPNLETARRGALPPADLALRNLDALRLTETAYERDFLSDIHYARAAWYLEQGHFKTSEASLIEAFNLDQTPLSANTYDYMAYRSRWISGKSQ